MMETVSFGSRAAAVPSPLSTKPYVRAEEVVELDARFLPEPPPTPTPLIGKVCYSSLVTKRADDVSQPMRKRCDEFDYIPLRNTDNLLGAFIPRVLTDKVRPFIINFCYMALDKFNAESQEDDAKYTFVDIVHFNTAVCTGMCFYITFLGRKNKSAADEDDDPLPNIATFQTSVWQKSNAEHGDVEVCLCRLKPPPLNCSLEMKHGHGCNAPKQGFT